MARYEHLPIYRDTLTLAVHFEKTLPERGAGFATSPQTFDIYRYSKSLR